MNKKPPPPSSTVLPPGWPEASTEEPYVLSLFISGITPRSTLALTNIKRICEARLHGRYTLEVIDIYQQPQLASANQVVAAPTLIKKSPSPAKRLIGDMSDEGKVLSGLDLSVS